MTKSIYRGFSTKQFAKSKSFVQTDMELVKEDLLNHIFTKKGTRVKMAQFGTRVPDLVFDPLDETTITAVREDILEVLNYDPRVRVVDFVVIPLYEESTIVVLADLEYVELDMEDRMSLKIQFQK